MSPAHGVVRWDYALVSRRGLLLDLAEFVLDLAELVLDLAEFVLDFQEELLGLLCQFHVLLGEGLGPFGQFECLG